MFDDREDRAFGLCRDVRGLFENESHLAIAAVERTLDATVRTSLRAFFTSGAAGLDCAYALEPEGQALE
jgi:hypothetical protein